MAFHQPRLEKTSQNIPPSGGRVFITDARVIATFIELSIVAITLLEMLTPYTVLLAFNHQFVGHYPVQCIPKYHGDLGRKSIASHNSHE